MLQLHIANRTEKLLETLADLIRNRGRTSLFEQEMFLVQSQGMEKIISQRLADEFASWCNFSFLMPGVFLQKVAAAYHLRSSGELCERGHLLWRLEALLRDLQGPEYEPLRRYLSDDCRKRYQLASELASLFISYQNFRPDFLAAWERAELLTSHDSEVWQSLLWRALRRDGGFHLPELYGKLSTQLAERRAAALPKRLYLVGIHTLPPLFLDFLKDLSAHCEVHLLLLSPSHDYWGDLAVPGARYQALLAGDKYVEDHPLLASLAQQGRDFQEMLVVGGGAELATVRYDEAGADTLLQKLQRSLFQGKMTSEKAAVDNSLSLVSCHSKQRELAIVKDYLLDQLYRDPALSLRDIVVMAPDIQEYAALIPALFSDIQYSISDRSSRAANPYFAAFLRYITLLSGRCGWSEMLELIRSEHVAAHFSLQNSDFELLQKWIVESGIRWGLSAEHRSFFALPELATNSWRAGLDRLLLGVAQQGGGTVAGIWSYDDIEGNSTEALGALCELVEYISDRQQLWRLPQSRNEWSEQLLADALFLFGEEVEPPLQELLSVLSQFAGDDVDEPLEFSVVAAWLHEQGAAARESHGFFRGHLTFCSLLPMRSIPFKVVAVLGLNEGSFPRQEKGATFDLQHLQQRLGDRSPRVDDRYQFLEALISARDSLYLSYVGRSIKNNNEIPPSVVISELLDYLQFNYGIAERDIVVEHPLHPYSSHYFSGGKLCSYDLNALELATTLGQKSSGESPPWWRGELSFSPSEVYLTDLIGFYKNPQRWFVSKSLDIQVGKMVDMPEESEAFSVDGLDRYLLQQTVVEELLAGKEFDDISDQLGQQGRWPLAEPGRVQFRALYAELVEFATVISELELGPITATQPLDLQLGKQRLLGQLSLRGDCQLIYRCAKLKGKDLLEAYISHVALTTALPGVRTYLVCRDKTISWHGACPAGILDKFLQIFNCGSRALSTFHIEAAFAYVQHNEGGRSKKSKLQVARETLNRVLTDGYEPELALALGTSTDEFLADEFEQLCAELMVPAWESYDEGN